MLIVLLYQSQVDEIHAPEADEEPKMLDEGLEGDFVDITKLGTKGADADKDDDSKKDVFADLKKINEEQKKKKEDDTDESTN